MRSAECNAGRRSALSQGVSLGSRVHGNSSITAGISEHGVGVGVRKQHGHDSPVPETNSPGEEGKKEND